MHNISTMSEVCVACWISCISFMTTFHDLVLLTLKLCCPMGNITAVFEVIQPF